MVSFPNSVWDGDSDSRDSNDGINASPTWQDWLRILQEIQAMQTKTLNDEEEGIGVINIYPGLAGTEAGTSALRRTAFAFNNMAMVITDTGVNGAHGSIKLYTFPDEHMNIFAGSLVGNMTAGAGGIANNAVLDIAIGKITTGLGNDVLSGDEQNITTKDDLTLVAGAKPFDVSSVVPVEMHGSTEIFLNVAIEAASVSANDILTISGSAAITWNHHEH